jgi:hypothetical protein
MSLQNLYRYPFGFSSFMDDSVAQDLVVCLEDLFGDVC